MKNIKYQIDNSFENIDKIRKIIYKTNQIIPNSYIYLGNIVSYSKYDDEDLKSIEEQQKLIDFNAKVNFHHFIEVNINDFYEYLYNCKYIEECQIIISEKQYEVEELYKILDDSGDFLMDLEILEGELFYIRYDDTILSDTIFSQ